MRRRSRPSPALRLAVRAGAAGAVGAAVAVPLLRQRGCGSRLRSRSPPAPPGPLALAVLRPRSKRRDVALFAMQMWAFTMVHELPYDDPGAPARPAPHPLPDRRRPRDRRSAGCPTPACSARLARLPRVGAAQPRPHLGPLALVLRALRARWPDPRPPPRALPARRAPDGGGLRPRLRRLLRGADRAALVVLRAGPDRRRGAADHGRGRRGHLGRGLAARCTTRSAATPGRRCPRCTSPPRWSAALSLAEAGQGRGRGRLGLRADARLRPRLPRRALRHRSDRRRGAGRRRCGAASRSPSRSSRGQSAACSAWSGSRAGSFLDVPGGVGQRRLGETATAD